MSQFDRYTVTEYVEALRLFLGASKRTFLRDAGFIKDDAPRKGRLKRKEYEAGPLKDIEAQVNAKAARCEAPGSVEPGDAGTTMGERIVLAKDYQGLNDAQMARDLGVSRELVRRWSNNIHVPKNLQAVADYLNVPEAWLRHGGEETLPGNSHIGVRVGDEAKMWREQLRGLIQSVVEEIPEEADDSYTQAYIEWVVLNRAPVAQAARRAGGRWQWASGMLFFVPWVPIPEHGLAKQYWSDEVEAIIQEELQSKPTTYGAWKAIKARCEAMGLTEDDYPRRVSLHKRVQKDRERIQEFGVDLNEMVAESVAKYTKQ